MSGQRPPALEKFIGELRDIWSRGGETGDRMTQALPHLEEVVRDPLLQRMSADWPSTEGRKNLLLYVDPDYEFAINAVVRVPGRTGSVHGTVSNPETVVGFGHSPPGINFFVSLDQE